MLTLFYVIVYPQPTIFVCHLFLFGILKTQYHAPAQPDILITFYCHGILTLWPTITLKPLLQPDIIKFTLILLWIF